MEITEYYKRVQNNLKKMNGDNDAIKAISWAGPVIRHTAEIIN